MSSHFREFAKSITGSAAATLLPQARYGRMILVLSHMRGATTAITNVLCSHPSVAGYGETHVLHNSRHSPGRVVVNLALRGAIKPGARYLCDKILHSELDQNAPAEFFKARAIFVLRAPGPSIRSLAALARKTNMAGYQDLTACARYYAERVEALSPHWQAFPRSHRHLIMAEELFGDPDGMVAQAGNWLGLQPALENRYVSHAASVKGGGGDPTRSADFTRIEARAKEDPAMPAAVAGTDLADRCARAYAALMEAGATPD
ncbi:MAG: sulfotransferase [Pseudomonadota bacterium]